MHRLLLSVLVVLAVPATALAARANPADDHVHVGMTKAGAAGKTSFWRRHTG